MHYKTHVQTHDTTHQETKNTILKQTHDYTTTHNTKQHCTKTHNGFYKTKKQNTNTTQQHKQHTQYPPKRKKQYKPTHTLNHTIFFLEKLYPNTHNTNKTQYL